VSKNEECSARVIDRGGTSLRGTKSQRQTERRTIKPSRVGEKNESICLKRGAGTRGDPLGAKKKGVGKEALKEGTWGDAVVEEKIEGHSREPGGFRIDKT